MRALQFIGDSSERHEAPELPVTGSGPKKGTFMTRRASLKGALWLSAASLALPALANAQDSAPAPVAPPSATHDATVKRVYTYADLAQYSPQSALDMVQRIPGFSVSRQGGGGNRGFGQANENIIVNGQRVSGKSNDTADKLSRIDAQKVVRIEIVDGAALDIPGLSGEVANIIYQAGKTSGQYRWQGTVREIGLPDNWTDGSVSLTGGGLMSNWTASLSNSSAKRGNVGPEEVRDAAGNLLLTRDERATFQHNRPRLAGSYSRTAANGNIFNVNAAGELFYYRGAQDGLVTPVGGAAYVENFANGEDEWNAEIGADYEFALGGGRLKLIGLQRYEDSDFNNRFEINGFDGSGYDEQVLESESVARAEYGFKALGGDAQISMEGAYNWLKQNSQLLAYPIGGAPSLVDLPETVIDEVRGEMILSLSRNLSDTLSVQVNGGAEYSRIGFEAATSATRDYLRPKGSLALAWKARPWATVNVKAERIVDQLNFFQFLSAIDVQDSVDRSSNSDIVPQQRWKLRGEVVMLDSEWGSLTPFAEWQRIEDPITFIPVGATDQALGNLTSAATTYDVGADATLLLDPLGLEGVRFDLHGHRLGSNVIDPLLLNERALDGQELYHFRIEGRHDVPNTDIVYGFRFAGQDRGYTYQLGNQFVRNESGARVDLFVAHKNVMGLNVRLDLYNILENEAVYERIAYVGRRGGPVAFTESYRREAGKILDITVEGSF